MTVVQDAIVEVDGRPATLEQIWELDRARAGHFTAMQVRGGRTQGLAFHLSRLDAASRELFGAGLDPGLVRGYIRHALAGGPADSSVRVNVYRPGQDRDQSVAVSVRPAASPPVGPLSLQSVRYQRPAAHIKHSAGFGQSYFAGLAQGNGFDEALFTGPGGVICEGSITNIAFIEGDAIVWPDAPALRGVTMQVLQRELARARVPWRYGRVRLADLPGFAGAFLTNSHGLAAVARIDGIVLPLDAPLLRSAVALLAAAAYDPI